MTNVIEIRHLSKRFKKRRNYRDFFMGRHSNIKAIDDLSLEIREGEIFGLLGPNGAGKTTLIKILSSLILPTNGMAKIYDYDVVKDVWRIKNLIGLIHSDERSFFWRLTGRQNLEFFASLFQVPRRLAKSRIDELLSLAGLEKDADNLFHNYSTGMKQKLSIARGLLNKPKILFMDEAMRSIDPISTMKIRDFIKKEILQIVQGTVLLATNRLDEASDLCDRVAVLNEGRLVACGSTEKLVTSYQNSIQYEIDVRNLSDELFKHICGMSGIQNCVKRAQMDGKSEIVISMNSEEESLHLVLQEIIKRRGYIQKCARIQPSLETVFETIINRSQLNRHMEHNR
jgi:ABC-2 type transport system ATP-binding protein